MSHLRQCCVPCCKNEKFSLVHKFPSDNERAERWRQALTIDNFLGMPIEVIRKRYFVCSRHFRDSDYKNKASRSLNTTAVPSINLFALDAPEGLRRKIPSPVRPPMVAYFRASGSGVTEQAEQEVALIEALEEPPEHHHEQDDKTLAEFIKTEEFIQQHDQQSDKSSSITYELNNFIDDSFTSDPTITMTTITKGDLLEATPTATDLNRDLTIHSPCSVAGKRALLKRPHSSISVDVVTVPVKTVPQGSTPPTPSPGKQGRFFPPQSPLLVPVPTTSEPIVLKRVKMAPFVKERKQITTSCAMTQTDDLQTSTDNGQNEAENLEGEQDQEHEGAENVPVASTQSTKILALLECTPENLQRLQKKLIDQGGALCLDERLLHLDDEDEAVREGDKAMAPSKADDKSKFLTIRNAQTQATTSVSYVWLRDHCRCAECYNATTFQRSYTILDLPLDIEPESCNINNERIDITWKDGHQSTYDLNDIFENNLDTYRKRLAERRSQLVLWDRALISSVSNGSTKTSGLARVTLNELLCEDDVMRQVVRSLVTYGVAFITKVPPNQQSTEIAVKRIFPIHRTLFGEMWTFSDTMDHSDTSYTNAYLGPHTDNTYFSDAAGLLVLHCIQFNGTGAESILLDGFEATERLRKADPDAFERLCRYPLEAEYIEEDKHHRYVAPIIRRHPCSSVDDPDESIVEQIRFNLYDRAPLRTLPPEMVPQFYADYQQLAREISNEELHWKFQLTPGTVMIFDNWRLLHGRMAYRGKRVMTGCYVARTEFQSVARTMGLIE
ncbi:epsilon-trimethyllysine 2-oxoglutarate dioxygenase [Anopheles sinensis]|uniref:Trimethyllysine dioxygenase, mitochondrial n=1 Tax=Anopheles sinensis TaxID=74873 RepID=A0A084VDL8_ANOSI|nr:epsilon-trimethyllysine 2-oxoglutarate dioxygenase [Anopheles sinensis]